MNLSRKNKDRWDLSKGEEDIPQNPRKEIHSGEIKIWKQEICQKYSSPKLP